MLIIPPISRSNPKTLCLTTEGFLHFFQFDIERIYTLLLVHTNELIVHKNKGGDMLLKDFKEPPPRDSAKELPDRRLNDSGYIQRELCPSFLSVLDISTSINFFK